jgi:hypothetical protein
VVTIADENRVKTDWNLIRAEYVAGGISQQELAKKYNVSYPYMMRKSSKEHWVQQREDAIRKGIEKSQAKTADVNADRAVVASRIKLKLLLRLEKEVDALPDLIGSESRDSTVEKTVSAKKDKNGKAVSPKAVISEKTKAYKLKDLTSALKDLTEDLTTESTAGNELLQSLMNLERRSIE